MKIIVLGGGNSPEREVSLRSASAVTTALKTAGYEVIETDPANGLAALDGFDGIVFPILHGAGGEDGEIQEELEKRHLPYLGTNSLTSVICFDKWKARQIYERTGLPIAKGALVNRKNYKQHPLAKNPHVLKITQGGSSIGTLIAREPAKIKQSDIDAVFELGDEAVLEELIEGVEITVPVFDTKPLPVIEIKPPVNMEFDYLNKYNGATQEICPPVSIDSITQSKAQELGLKAHQALGCRHLSRTDIMVNNHGDMFVLETNTMPGMTTQSLYPIAAKEAGMSMPELVKKFVEMVQRDYKLKETKK